MKKRVIIEACSKCPYYYVDYLNNRHLCSHDSKGFGKKINDYPEIPEWCPLEDADEKAD